MLPGAMASETSSSLGKNRRGVSAEGIEDICADNVGAALRAAVEELEASNEAEKSGNLVDLDGGGGR